MKPLFLSATAIASMAAATAVALEPQPGARLGTSPAEISATLGEDGYEVTRYEREGGRIELTAIKEDRRVEVYLDGSTGEVTGVEERTRRGPSPLPGIGDAGIRAALEADGYEIVEYERERGRVEVHADRGGRRYELEIDPRDGRVVEVEEER